MTFVSRLWRTDPVLVATGVFLAALIVPFGVGILVDPRVITGAPAWLKPLKFAVSTALYCFTLAWVFTYLPDWPRLRRIVGRGTAAALRARGGDDRRPGRARHDQPLQRGDAARRHRLRQHGRDHRRPDLSRGGADRRDLAAALRGSGARLGAAHRPRRHRARSVHRRPDDAADGGPARRGAGGARDADLRRAHGRRARRRPGPARHRLEHTARRHPRAALHRPARLAGAAAARAGRAAARQRSSAHAGSPSSPAAPTPPSTSPCSSRRSRGRPMLPL